MDEVPRAPGLDDTFALMRDGYEFIRKRCDRLGTDAFRTRLLGKRAVCMRGAEAARLFYDETKLRRRGAIPRRLRTSLFGKNAIQALDGEAHQNRRAAFLALMTRENLERLMDLSAQSWRRSIRRWERSAEPIVLLDEAQRALTEAACAWTGVPLDEAEIPSRARDLGRMVDAFGGVGPRMWKGKAARARTERWMTRLVERVRRGSVEPDARSALHVLSWHRDLDGRLLPTRDAAIEVLNVIRPIVSVTWFVVFAALALHEHPAARERIACEEPTDGAGPTADAFMQEVRRFYPFTPMLAARVRAPFVWRGHTFGLGTLVVLDVYGTNHDPRSWEHPDRFVPERFERWRGDPFAYIPQGGGDRVTSHRCPGEWITMHEVALALHLLTRCMTYEVPAAQDLTIELRRIPAQPRSGFMMRDVRATRALDRITPSRPSATAAREAAAAERSEEDIIPTPRRAPPAPGP